MASVFLGDLDDFIAPGQACINPLFVLPDAKPAAATAKAAAVEVKRGNAPMQLMLEDDEGPGLLDAVPAMVVEESPKKPDLIRATGGSQAAKVSLDDCLACSGCVTSAETVLITQQSAGRLQEAVKLGRYAVIIASITPQARASLAERFGLSPAETQARLLTFLKGEGVHYLVDASLGADFSLLEAGEEFVRRYRYRGVSNGVEEVGGAGGAAPPPPPPPWAAPPPTVALSSNRRFNVEVGKEEERISGESGVFSAFEGGDAWRDERRLGGRGGGGSVAIGSGGGGGIGSGVGGGGGGGGDAALGVSVGGGIGERGGGVAGAAGGGKRGAGELLVLTSACPGWVCYAEKTAPEALPFMSTVKSPQQIMGVLAKRVLPQAWGLPSPAPETTMTTPTTQTSTTPTPPTAATPVPMVLEIGGVEEDASAPPPRVFHASIAQCYDKKLEASRKDFRHDDLEGEAEVDLVLTTAEVLELIEERAAANASTNAYANTNTNANITTNISTNPNTANGGINPPHDGFAFESPSPTIPPPPTDAVGDFFRSHPPFDLSKPLAPGFPSGQAAVSADGSSLYGGVDGEGAAGGGSGGYLEHVFRYAALRLFGVDLAGQPLVYREGRNSDFRETCLEVDGRVVLRFAYAYGFRNIQSILAKARRGKCPYHLVEVMACPSGCVNGGGQIKPKKEGPRDTRRRVEKVSEVLRSKRTPRNPQENPLVHAVYRQFRGGGGGVGAGGGGGVGGGCGARKERVGSGGEGGGAGDSWDLPRDLLHTSYHNVPKLELSNPHMSPW